MSKFERFVGMRHVGRRRHDLLCEIKELANAYTKRVGTLAIRCYDVPCEEILSERQTEINPLKMVAAIIGIFGIGLAAIAFPAWWQYSRYTVTVEGVVVERTATSCAIKVEGTTEFGSPWSSRIDYSKISGTGSDVPPEDGPKFNLGDKVAVIHPPGKRQDARLKKGFAPTEPIWPGWVGVVLVVFSVGMCVVERKGRGDTRTFVPVTSNGAQQLEDLPARAKLLNDVRNILTLLAGFAIGMYLAVLLHELGHALGYWLSGGSVTAIVMQAPLPAGFVTGEGGNEMMITWGGVVFGSLITLVPLVMAWRLSPQSPIHFAVLMTASFCLGHNAMYLFVGSLVPYVDAVGMVELGAPRWLLLLFSIPLLIGFVLVLTSAIRVVGLRPTDSVWKWIAIVQLGLLPVLAVMLVVMMFIPSMRSIRLPILLLVGSYALCYCVVAYRARSATVSSDTEFEHSRMRQGWRQTVGLIVVAFLLIVVEWLAFGPA